MGENNSKTAVLSLITTSEKNPHFTSYCASVEECLDTVLEPIVFGFACFCDALTAPVANQGFSLEFSFSVCFLSDSAFLVDSQVEQSDDKMAGHTTLIFCGSGVDILQSDGVARNLSSSLFTGFF